MNTLDTIALIVSSNVVLVIIQYIIGYKRNKAEVKDIVSEYYSRTISDMNNQIITLTEKNQALEERLDRMRYELNNLAERELHHMREKERCLNEKAELEKQLRELKFLKKEMLKKNEDTGTD